MEYQVLMIKCVHLWICRLCFNFQDLCALEIYLLSASYLYFIIMIDFLSIEKVLCFSTIATDDHHPLWSRFIY